MRSTKGSSIREERLPAPLGLTRQPVGKRYWLAGSLASWRAIASAKELTWPADIPASLPTLAVIHDWLAQALGHLLSNALRHTPVGGTICVEEALEGSVVAIRVTDTGPGIAPE